ncbi:unnamed protein product, partial [Symbiodinium pilosum]
LSQVGLKFCLRKTKTSGPGRKVGELFAYISRSAGLSGFDWLTEGMRLLANEQFSWSRDFFCPAMSDAWDVQKNLILEAEGLAILLRRMLGCLREPTVKNGAWATSTNLLVPDKLRTFWSGHSARHTLPSIAAALDVGKDRRDFLGRWCYAQHGSQDYILTSRQVVHGIQNLISKTVLEGNADGGYIEEEVLAGVKQACADLALDQQMILRRHMVSKWDAIAKCWKLHGRYPHIMIRPEQLQGASGDIGAQLPGPFHAWNAEESLGEAPYFVTVSRKGCQAQSVVRAVGPRLSELDALKCPAHLVAMSAVDLPAGVTQDAALDFFEKNLTTELLHIFNECGVPVGLQYKLGQHFKNVKKFSTYADARSDVRAALKADHALEATNQDTRAAVASVVSAWESCREFSAKESELKAEARVLGVSRPIKQTEHQAMRISYEKTFGSLDEVVEPSADYLSTKMEEVENGEIVASPFSDVTSKRKVKTLGIQTSVDAGGHVRIVKQRNQGSLPQNTEDLRTVLRVEGNAWVFLASKYKNKIFLKI